jgi:hypothetical protein
VCSAQHQQQAQQCVQGTYCGVDVKTRFLAARALASTTCNNFIADLLFLSEVSHPLLVAAGCGLWLRALRLRLLRAAAAGLGSGPLRAAAQHPLLGLACGAEGRKQSKRIGG